MSQAGPKLPLEKTANMPAASQLASTSSNHGFSTLPLASPQELLMTCGRRSVRGFSPARSVGASIHCAEASSAPGGHLRSSSRQPFAAIHRAPGATPIWLAAPSSPTIVPTVWVPCEMLSQGPPDGSPQTSAGSYQL